MYFILGPAMIAAGLALAYIARPRNGQRAAFLAIPTVEPSYAILISALTLMGFGTTLAGIISLFGA